MTKFIEVSEFIPDKKSDFGIKRFNVGKINSERPIKSVDSRTITQQVFKRESSYFQNPLFETPKRIDSDQFSKVLNGSDSYVKSFFGNPEWLDNFEHLISPTFTFNPFSIPDYQDQMSGFFSYYYNFSKTFLFVPNIKAIKIIYELGTSGRMKKTGEESIVSLKEYIDFVNESYTILNERNSKPIFVPFSLKFPIEDIPKLTREYLSKEYSHIWVDFEADTTTDRIKLGKLRRFYSLLRESERLENTIVYVTNMRREITSNRLKPENPSSDILSPFCGGNFVGVNQQPERGFSPPPPPMNVEAQIALWEYKARVFDPHTYYYTNRNLADVDENIAESLFDPKYNRLYNTKQLDIELNNQANRFLENFDVEEYISNKSMVFDDSSRSLKKNIFYKKYEPIQTTLADILPKP